MPIRKETWSNT